MGWDDQKGMAGLAVFCSSIVNGDPESIKKTGGVYVIVTSRLIPYVDLVRTSEKGSFVSVTLQSQQDKNQQLLVDIGRSLGIMAVEMKWCGGSREIYKF